MKVGLLGPLEMAGPTGPVRLGGAKERLVLALLLLRAGEVVSCDALVDAVWADSPPATAVKTLQGYVARTRRALEAAGLADVLVTRDPGYLLCVPADAIDLADFERHAAAGRGALLAGDASGATAALCEALVMWRGDALADCRGGGWAAAEAVRLDEMRLTTVEDRVDADLMLGQHGVLVGELESLVARHPLRERLWGVLMVALYRGGRQADAVRAYQRARDVSVEELGEEPGAELRRLEAAVLAGDRALDLDPPRRGDIVDSGTAIEVPLPGRVSAASSVEFVGRVHELDGLHTSWKAAVAGERRVVLISGEPGIGKTSLSAAFSREVFDRGAVVLYGRSDDGLGIPYQPWTEVLAHLVAHAPADVLAAHVDARGDEVATLAPGLVGGGAKVRPSSTDAESERYLLFGAVVDLLERVSALSPVLLVLDDLHWADRATIQLLRHVVSADAPLRLLVMGTFRDSDVGTDDPLAEALAALHRESGVDRVTLSGLSGDEVLTLLEVTAQRAMTEDGAALRDALLADTDGNPFFVVEMLRHQVEIGAIHRDEQDRWVAAGDLMASGLPLSIREVLVQRVARLGPPATDVLSAAAVLGRDFDADVLARVAELDERTVADVCDRAVSAALLTEVNVAGRYAFAHALIEHALHDGLPAGRRGRTHRRVAETLEVLRGDDAGERVGELAHHWARAAPPDAGKAMAYAQRAGDRALAQLAPEEALRWYRDALDLLDHRRPDDPRRRAELLLGLGDAQRQVGEADHRETLLSAGRLADDIDALDILVAAALRNNRGFNSIIGSVDHERVDMLTRVIARVGDTESPDLARLLAMLCIERTWETDFDERLSMATHAVDVARRTGDDAALVDAIRLCHESIAMPEALELRLRWDTEACALAERLDDPIARLFVNSYRSLDALEVGDLATMREAYGLLESAALRIGQPLHRWHVAYHRALDTMLEGDLHAAEGLATDALARGTEAGFPDDAVTVYGAQLCTVRLMQGRLHEMIPLVDQVAHHAPALRTFSATRAFAMSFDDDRHDEVRRLLDTEVADDFPMAADASWLVGHVLWAGAAERTRHRAAASALHARLSPWHDQFATTRITVHGNVAHHLGLLDHTLGRHDEAEQWFEQALALHEEMEAPFFVALTQVAWANLLAHRSRLGDARRAQALVRAALPVASERGYAGVERDARSVVELVG